MPSEPKKPDGRQFKVGDKIRVQPTGNNNQTSGTSTYQNSPGIAGFK